MQVDMGYIIQYNTSTGAGLLNPTFLTNQDRNQKVHFDHSTVGDKNLEQRLQKKNWRGVRVYFAYECVEDTNRAISLWLPDNDLPFPFKEHFLQKLEEYWFDLTRKKPDWLDSITKTIGGLEIHVQLNNERIAQEAQIQKQAFEIKRKAEEEESKKKEAYWAQIRDVEARAMRTFEEAREKERLAREKDRQAIEKARIKRAQEAESRRKAELERRPVEIHDLCRSRGITNLIHFTRIENLASILVKGLLCRETLEKNPERERPIFNDPERLDNHKNAICLSISFPNYRMFYRLRQQANSKWVVLVLDATILWELDCAFNQTNAASNGMRQLPLTSRKMVCSLSQMFDDNSERFRIKYQLPDAYTTDPQAEVLVFDPIPPSYFQSIHFNNSQEYKEWRTQNQQIFLPDTRIGSQFFNPRSDYDAWSIGGNEPVQSEVSFDSNDIPF